MLQDIKYAWRSLARNPLFVGVAVLTLGVGIGVNTAVFSCINVMLLKPLLVRAGEDLIWISSASTKPNGPQGNMTYPDVVDLGEVEVLDGATAYGFFQANLATSGQAVRLDGEAVMGNSLRGSWRPGPPGTHFDTADDLRPPIASRSSASPSGSASSPAAIRQSVSQYASTARPSP